MSIERAVVSYLLSYFAASPTLASVIGTRIYYRRPPQTTKLPWIRVTNSGGMRNILTQGPNGSTEVQDVLTIYVDDDQQFRGKQIADAVVAALENYRGDMPSTGTAYAYDTHFRMGTVRDLDGFQDAYTYLLSVYVRYRFPTAFPS